MGHTASIIRGRTRWTGAPRSSLRVRMELDVIVVANASSQNQPNSVRDREKVPGSSPADVAAPNLQQSHYFRGSPIL
jgi:hypothetical protein